MKQNFVYFCRYFVALNDYENYTCQHIVDIGFCCGSGFVDLNRLFILEKQPSTAGGR